MLIYRRDLYFPSEDRIKAWPSKIISIETGCRALLKEGADPKVSVRVTKDGQIVRDINCTDIQKARLWLRQT